jgi:K+-sensing histidine kinase KdpD
VWVTTSVHPKTVVLTVENTGEKLSPQLVSTLVEPFRRGTERIRTDHAGVGLGLAIVKSITQAHGGTLTLSPRAAGGLCVTVQLPAAPPHTGPELESSRRGTNPRSPVETDGSLMEPSGRNRQQTIEARRARKPA